MPAYYTNTPYPITSPNTNPQMQLAITAPEPAIEKVSIFLTPELNTYELIIPPSNATIHDAPLYTIKTNNLSRNTDTFDTYAVEDTPLQDLSYIYDWTMSLTLE